MTRSASASMRASATTSTSICVRSGPIRWSIATCTTSPSARARSSRSRPAIRLLSQVSQAITLDYRDSRIDPHTGYLAAFGTDFAGLGGNAHFVRDQPQRPVLRSAGSVHRQQRLGHLVHRQRRLPVQSGQAGADHRPVLPGRRQSARLPDRRRRSARCPHRRSARRPLHLDPIDRTALPVADFRRYRPFGTRLRRYRQPHPGEFHEPELVRGVQRPTLSGHSPPRRRVSAPASAFPGILRSV